MVIQFYISWRPVPWAAAFRIKESSRQALPFELPDGLAIEVRHRDHRNGNLAAHGASCHIDECIFEVTDDHGYGAGLLGIEGFQVKLANAAPIHSFPRTNLEIMAAHPPPGPIFAVIVEFPSTSSVSL